jgi:hypothetical protein
MVDTPERFPDISKLDNILGAASCIALLALYLTLLMQGYPVVMPFG